MLETVVSFIIFGCALISGEPTSDVHVLGIDKWEWKSSVPAIKQQKLPGENNTDNNGTSSSPNQGTEPWVIGMTVGLVVGILLGVS